MDTSINKVLYYDRLKSVFEFFNLDRENPYWYEKFSLLISLFENIPFQTNITSRFPSFSSMGEIITISNNTNTFPFDISHTVKFDTEECLISGTTTNKKWRVPVNVETYGTKNIVSSQDSDICPLLFSLSFDGAIPTSQLIIDEYPNKFPWEAFVEYAESKRDIIFRMTKYSYLPSFVASNDSIEKAYYVIKSLEL